MPSAGPRRAVHHARHETGIHAGGWRRNLPKAVDSRDEPGDDPEWFHEGRAMRKWILTLAFAASAAIT